MGAATRIGMLMNFLAAWLLISAVYILVSRIICIVRKKAFVGIWKLYEYPLARRYLLQAILHNCLWVTAGLAVFIAMIPIQFPQGVWSSVLWQLGGAVTILCLLEWIPPRRISWPTNAFFVVMLFFLSFQLVKIYMPHATKEYVVVTAPFRGEWYTFHGGNSSLINHHYYAGSQRYALDLLLSEDGPLPLMGETDLQKYRTFGQPLFSPVDGVIVDARNDCRDQSIGSTDPANAAGNYVTIKTKSAMFILLAHLQEESVLVKKHDRVLAGQTIAKCGNSGNSSQPHLHIQAMSTPELFSANSRPIQLRFKLPGHHSSRTYKRNDTINGLALSHDAGP